MKKMTRKLVRSLIAAVILTGIAGMASAGPLPPVTGYAFTAQVNARSAGNTISVPEPGIVGMFGFGLLGLNFALRRRRSKH